MTRRAGVQSLSSHRPHGAEARRAEPARSIRWGLGLVLSLSTACKSASQNQERPPVATSEPGEPGKPAAPAAPSEKYTPTVHTQMKWHAGVSRRLFDAVIAGDLTQLQTRARSLAQDEWSPALEPAWKTHYEAVRRAARDVETAQSARGAAAAMGRLGVACGECHQEAHSGPKAETPEQPPADHQGMLQHRWAVQQLWVGLSAPSDAAWLRGARALQSAPLIRSDSEDIEVLAQRVVELGRSAEAAGPSERAPLFARSVLTCGTCHHDLGLEIPPGSDVFSE